MKIMAMVLSVVLVIPAWAESQPRQVSQSHALGCILSSSIVATGTALAGVGLWLSPVLLFSCIAVMPDVVPDKEAKKDDH